MVQEGGTWKGKKTIYKIDSKYSHITLDEMGLRIYYINKSAK